MLALVLLLIIPSSPTIIFAFIKGGSYGIADGQFRGPAGIAVDSSGNVYAVDSGNNRTQVFASVNHNN